MQSSGKNLVIGRTNSLAGTMTCATVYVNASCKVTKQSDTKSLLLLLPLHSPAPLMAPPGCPSLQWEPQWTTDTLLVRHVHQQGACTRWKKTVVLAACLFACPPANSMLLRKHNPLLCLSSHPCTSRHRADTVHVLPTLLGRISSATECLSHCCQSTIALAASAPLPTTETIYNYSFYASRNILREDIHFE
jgi:hypothetical protein